VENLKRISEFASASTQYLVPSTQVALFFAGYRVLGTRYFLLRLAHPAQLIHRPIAKHGLAVDVALIDGTEVAAVV
jgi:hypothetical protein